MGNIDVKQCKFLDLPAIAIWTSLDAAEYSVDFDNQRYFFTVGHYYFFETESPYLLKNKYIIKGLLLNKKWPNKVKFSNEDDLKKLLSQYSYPQKPHEKLDSLFEYIFEMQTKDGEQLEFESFWQTETWAKLYFKDDEECAYYTQVLHEKGLINGSFGMDSLLYSANVTFDGLIYFNQLTNEGLKSKNCFIAMSFSSAMNDIRYSIKSACEKTNYTAIVIDEVHGDADKTINDQIIASIKKSRFCIADFTEQRDGVYFESGYALGRGLKVIYTCREDHFKQSHFDTNHFPHIIYSTTTELEEKLINKIEAWIND